MYLGQKVVVVLPAYRAALTLKQTYDEIPFDLVDEIVLVDDNSPDKPCGRPPTGPEACVVHEKNTGYGGNQKSCYDKATGRWAADIVVMLHPDYQYTPKLLPSMVSLSATGFIPWSSVRASSVAAH
jgi:glycosyltransferase involved in cell wall biosynthesis